MALLETYKVNDQCVAPLRECGINVPIFTSDFHAKMFWLANMQMIVYVVENQGRINFGYKITWNA